MEFATQNNMDMKFMSQQGYKKYIESLNLNLDKD